MTKTKILVLHPNPNNLDDIIKKANTQNLKNGPFEAVIFLGIHDLAPPSTTPQVPTYYCSSTKEDDAFTDKGENFVCVSGEYSTLKLSSGVKIGFLGQFGAEVSEEVDILVSFHWPLAVAKTQGLSIISDEHVDKSATKLRPRYHFVVGSERGRFYEHPAFSWSGSRACRVISLAQEGSGNKWFYAFGIDPEAEDSPSAGTNPYSTVTSTVEQSEEVKTQKLQPLKRHTENEDGIPVKRPKVVAPQDCFFCLSNPNIESHMIVAIGKYSYLATAKGAMPLPQRPLDFSGHAIIIPFDHTPTLEEESAPRIEMAQFQQTVAQAFYEKSFATVFFQISRPENVHIHTQLIPVRIDGAQEQLERSLAERTRQNNERARHNQQLCFTSRPQEVRDILSTNNFIKFVLSMGDEVKVYAAQLVSDKPVDLQFPRRVMSFHLKCPKRTYWDRCQQTKGQETTECQKFKEFYKNYDFTSMNA